jgi:hypothetical protein
MTAATADTEVITWVTKESKVKIHSWQRCHNLVYPGEQGKKTAATADTEVITWVTKESKVKN